MSASQDGLPTMMDEQLRQQQDLYDRSWRGGLDRGKEQRGNLQTNLDFLTRTGLLRPGDKMLEIGCGIGTVVSELSRQGYDVVGTDISQVAVEYGRAKYGDIHLEVQPAEKPAFDDEAFDVILSFDLFEHIAAIDEHVAEVRRLLKPQGYYLFQTPNKCSNAVFETLSHKSLQWRRYHPSLHTPGQIRRRLARHGFDTRFVKMDPLNDYTVAKLKKLGLLGALVRRVNFTKLPLVLQTNLYVIAQKGRP
jgi:2-polyprenyl-3-methyl-5-hydroxy-6-metoxy-1,4-benzoquinol methylase